MRSSLQLEQDPRVIHALRAIQRELQASVPTDLTRLRRARPDLTRAYDQLLLDQAWQLIAASGVTPQPVRIGIIDTGVDLTHPEFTQVKVIRTRLRRASIPTSHGHGTQMAGIIGANDNGAGPPAMNGIVAGVSGGSRDVPTHYHAWA